MKQFTILFLFIATQANASPFETLRDLYNTAQTAASFSDFDLAGTQSSNQHCVLAGEEYEKALTERFFHYVISFSESPSQGPAFPDSKIRDVLAFSDAIISRADGIQAFQHQTVEVSPIELTLTFIKGKGYPAKPLQVKIRKKDNLLPFFAYDNFGNSNQKAYYGYCFRE